MKRPARESRRAPDALASLLLWLRRSRRADVPSFLGACPRTPSCDLPVVRASVDRSLPRHQEPPGPVSVGRVGSFHWYPSTGRVTRLSFVLSPITGLLRRQS